MKKERKSEKGQAAVEFGVILPGLIILILAVVLYGRPYLMKLSAQNVSYTLCSAVPRSPSVDYYIGDIGDERYVTSHLPAVGKGYLINVHFGTLLSGTSSNAHSVSKCSTFLDGGVDSPGFAGLKEQMVGKVKGVAAFAPAPFLSREYGK